MEFPVHFPKSARDNEYENQLLEEAKFNSIRKNLSVSQPPKEALGQITNKKRQNSILKGGLFHRDNRSVTTKNLKSKVSFRDKNEDSIVIIPENVSRSDSELYSDKSLSCDVGDEEEVKNMLPSPTKIPVATEVSRII